MAIRNKPRQTKIVATIGPACDAPHILKAMLEAGMNVARLNLSHGHFDEHSKRIERLRQIAVEIGINLAIMIDTRGIEIRTGRLQTESVTLAPGSVFNLHTKQRLGDCSGVSVSYKKLVAEVKPGDPILLDDGAIELEVEAAADATIRCRVIHGGTLRENKSVNLPETTLSISAVSPETRDDVTKEMRFAVDHDVDYIAASFVQTADDIERMRQLLAEQDRNIPLIAKIENRAGVSNLTEIVAAADGIMVARGDLGVELPLADVPGTQKKIIRTTVMNGKPVITATQMLASMEVNPKPTRAEASDVANAILDGSSAVMLSGETAMGRYPVEAVKTMASLASRAEVSLPEYGYLQTILPHPSHFVTEAVSQAAVQMAKQLRASAIFSLTETGFSTRLISKHRPECPILAITTNQAVIQRLAMNWGVIVLPYQGKLTDEGRITFGIQQAKKLGYLAPKDIVITVNGHTQKAGGTDSIRAIEISE